MTVQFSTISWTNALGDKKTTMVDSTNSEAVCNAMKERGVSPVIEATDQ